MARITSGRAPSRELNALGVSALASNGFMLIWAGLLFSQLRCYVVAVTIGLWYHEQVCDFPLIISTSRFH